MTYFYNFLAASLNILESDITPAFLPLDTSIKQYMDYNLTSILTDDTCIFMEKIAKCEKEAKQGNGYYSALDTA